MVHCMDRNTGPIARSDRGGTDPEPAPTPTGPEVVRRRASDGTVFAGLSAFPLTPLRDDEVDEAAFAGLIERLASSRVDSITALGSTGSYAYLSESERSRVARLAVDHAGGIPVFVGIGATRTSRVIANADAAADAGASGLLLAPLSYQPLTDDEVFELFRDVTEHTPLPVILYDNPVTTRFAFTTELYRRIAELPGIASIKIPGIRGDAAEVLARIATIRSVIPARVTLGISGDPTAAAALVAGCDAWYSVVGGAFPQPALAITRAAQAGRAGDAAAESARLTPLWELFARFGGSLRVIAAAVEHLGRAPDHCLPLPIHGLTTAERSEVARVVSELGLG